MSQGVVASFKEPVRSGRDKSVHSPSVSGHQGTGVGQQNRYPDDLPDWEHGRSQGSRGNGGVCCRAQEGRGAVRLPAWQSRLWTILLRGWNAAERRLFAIADSRYLVARQLCRSLRFLHRPRSRRPRTGNPRRYGLVRSQCRTIPADGQLPHHIAGSRR